MSEFLAEAQILIQANTVAFKAELAAALATVPKQITIPIVATAPAAGATKAASAAVAAQQQAGQAAQQSAAQVAAASKTATAAIQQQTAAATAGAAAQRGLSVSSATSATTNRRLAAASKLLTNAQREEAGSSGQLAAAERAVAAATEAVAAANRGASASQKILARDALAAAEAFEVQAAAARRAAISQAKSATRASEVQKGLQAQAASAVGLRGAIIGANTAFILATAGAIAFGKAIKSTTDLQTNLNVFAATAGATAEQMRQVSEAAQELGADVSLPAVSAGDAAEAMTELAKAGLSVQDSIAGARGVLQLATAAQISNADAVQISASALNAFGLAGNQAVHVADLLANAANQSQGSISDMGLSLQQAAAVSRQVGVSLDDTVALLTLLARNGLRGSDAGTALRTSFIRLINPTQKAKEQINKLGLAIRDESGAVRPEVFADFNRVTADMTAKQRDAAAALIFGQDAIRALAILAREGASGLDKMRTAVEKEGTAAELAAARTKGLAGQIQALQSNLETAAVALGQILTPVLSSLVGGTNKIVTGFNLIARAIQGLGQDNFDRPNADLQEMVGHVAELGKEIDDLRRSGGAGTEAGLVGDLGATQKQVNQVARALLDTDAGTRKFFDSFARQSPQIASAINDHIITPMEKSELQTTALGRALVNALPKRFFQQLGPDIRSSLEDAAAEAKRGAISLGPAIHSAVEDAGRQAVIDARTVGDKVGSALREGIFAGIRRATGQQAGLEEAMNEILASGGSPQQQIANLQKQAAAQAKIIADAGPNAAGNVLKERRAARQRLAAINQQITALQKQITADQQTAANAQEQAAKDAQAARDKADQAVLDSFTPAQNRLNLAEISANATDRLSDNVKLQNAIIAEAHREVEIIKDTVKSVKTRNAELAKQAEVIKTAETERASLLAQIAQTATENRQKAANALAESLGKAITLAELREDDQAEVVAINKAIANARKRIKNYKKLGLNLQDEQIALEELINKRDEVLNTARDGSRDAGTTLVDLFKSTQEIFDQAGNVGRTPGSLTTNSANAPIRDMVQQRLDIQLRQLGGDTVAKRQVSSTERLISTMEQLIQVIGQGTGVVVGNKAASGSGGLGKAVDAAARFKYQRVANSIVEAGVWG
jgi:TP901 family phage tail tape measure protein